jgi:hypothetical protein
VRGIWKGERGKVTIPGMIGRKSGTIDHKTRSGFIWGDGSVGRDEFREKDLGVKGSIRIGKVSVVRNLTPIKISRSLAGDAIVGMGFNEELIGSERGKFIKIALYRRGSINGGRSTRKVTNDERMTAAR